MTKYAEGYEYGIEWAEHDLANAIPPTAEMQLLSDETHTQSRKMRAFYLGALRGYRQVVRTLRNGRWGS